MSEIPLITILQDETLRNLARTYGFVESDEMFNIRGKIEDGDNRIRRNLVITYVYKGQELVDLVQDDPEMYARLQIALYLAVAAMYGRLEMDEEFEEAMSKAYEYAYNMYFDDIVHDIDVHF